MSTIACLYFSRGSGVLIPSRGVLFIRSLVIITASIMVCFYDKLLLLYLNPLSWARLCIKQIPAGGAACSSIFFNQLSVKFDFCLLFKRILLWLQEESRHMDVDIAQAPLWFSFSDSDSPHAVSLHPHNSQTWSEGVFLLSALALSWGVFVSSVTDHVSLIPQ